MRSRFLIAIRYLELVAAVGLLILAVQMPSAQDLHHGFDQVQQVTNGAEKQIGLLRDHVQDLRSQDFHRLAQQVQKTTQTLSITLEKQTIRFETVESLANALGQTAKALESWGEALDPERVKKLSAGLDAAVDFLDKNVVQSSFEAARGIEQAMTNLETDALRLSSLLEKAPPDLKAAREISESLKHFHAGMEKLTHFLKGDKLEAIREGFSGMESSLESTAKQVDKLSDFSYPIIKLNGFKPDVEMKPFWTEGPKIAEGLKKAVTGLKAAGTEMDQLQKDLPTIRKAMEESQKTIRKTQESMESALKQHVEIEKLLQSLPKQASTLAEELPRVGKSFAKMLRETERLKQMIKGLRQVQQTLDESLKNWPEIMQAMKQSARVLKGTQKQLQEVITRREEYEQAMASSRDVAKISSDLIPVLTEQFESRLAQQDDSLGQMHLGLKDVNRSMPILAQTTGQVMTTLRWLMFILAGLVGGHGIYMLVEGTRVR